MLSLDLREAIDGPGHNPCFSIRLFQLMFKADRVNFAKLSSIYPDQAIMIRHWREKGEITTIYDEG